MIRCAGANTHWSCTPETCRLYLAWPALSLCGYLSIASQLFSWVGLLERVPIYPSIVLDCLTG